MKKPSSLYSPPRFSNISKIDHLINEESVLSIKSSDVKKLFYQNFKQSEHSSSDSIL
jgi:hypothetical protein